MSYIANLMVRVGADVSDLTKLDLEKIKSGPVIPLRLMRAMATAALNSGSDDDRVYTTKGVGRIISEEGDKCELFAKVMELRVLAEGEEQPDPLPGALAPSV